MLTAILLNVIRSTVVYSTSSGGFNLEIANSSSLLMITRYPVSDNDPLPPVPQVTSDAVTLDGDAAGGEDGGDAEEEEATEYLAMASHVSYMAPLLRGVALLHMFTAFAMMVAYYCLKVSLRAWGSWRNSYRSNKGNYCGALTVVPQN